MANTCYFTCKIKGEKEKVKRVSDMFTSRSIGRVSEFRILEEYPEAGGEYSVEGDGECAWSIFAAMIETGRTNIIDLTREYEVKFEAYSEETGFEFQEHYIISGGVIKKQEIEDFREVCLEDCSSEEIEDLADSENISIEVLNKMASENSGFYRAGGFEEWQYEI